MTTPAPPRRARAALAIGLSLASACGLELSGTAIPYDGGTTHPYSGEDAFDGTMEDVADAGPADAPRDTAAADAASVDASDAPAPDATDASDDPSCSGLVCNGVCLPDASDCHACRGATLLCRSTRTCSATCAGCTDDAGLALPMECYLCDQMRANPVGTCEPNDRSVFCMIGGYDYHCDCDAGLSACPGREQVCTDIGVGKPVCSTCGEANGTTARAPCKGGGTCDVTAAVPTCH